MKKQLINIAGICLLAATLTLSCNKYEDGPAISLTPKKERVANTWVIEKAMDDGDDVTENYDQYELYLTDDGAAQLTAKYTILGTTYQTETSGTWEFRNNDENIYFDYEDNAQDGEYTIQRLTSKEMWLRKTGDDLELHFREK